MRWPQLAAAERQSMEQHECVDVQVSMHMQAPVQGMRMRMRNVPFQMAICQTQGMTVDNACRMPSTSSRQTVLQ